MCKGVFTLVLAALRSTSSLAQAAEVKREEIAQGVIR